MPIYAERDLSNQYISASFQNLLQKTGSLVLDGLGNELFDYSTLQTGSGITDHNDLHNIDGGTAGQYYHLTLDEYTGTGTGPFLRQSNPQFSGSVTINGDLNVTGTASFSNIISVTASQFIVDDNIITLNGYSPYFRYAGIEAIDSGSGVTASLLWDGTNDYWFMVSSSNQTSKLIGTAFGTYGNENNLTIGYIPVATSSNTITDSIIFQTGSKIGIGKINPSYTLDISGSEYATGNIISDGYMYSKNVIYSGDTNTSWSNNQLQFYKNGVANIINAHPGINSMLSICTANIERIRITSSGSVGINISIPSASLHVKPVSTDVTTNPFLVETSGSMPALFINKYGNIGIGNTNPLEKLDITGNVTISDTLTVLGVAIVDSLIEVSTRNNKENIVPLSSSLSSALKLNGVKYNLKGKNKTEIGFIAEDVYDIYPELVEIDNNNNPVGVSYSRVTAVLLESIKELKNQIDEQQKEINQLKKPWWKKINFFRK